jgi:hypothetical protein
VHFRLIAYLADAIAGELPDDLKSLHEVGVRISAVNAMIHPTKATELTRFPYFSQRLLELVDDLLAFDKNDRPNSAAEVSEKLVQVEPGSPGFWGNECNPFRGLNSYQPEHTEIYFGRDAAIRRGREILQSNHAPAWNGFLLITGASGAGKSSLARAGLGPALLRGDRTIGEENGEAVPIICDLGTIRTENDCLLVPLAQILAAALHGTESATIMAALRDTHADMGRALGFPVANTQPVECGVILDQFEHYLRADLTRNAQTRFLMAIARLAGTPGIAVLATLRSDCFHQCEAHPLLMDLMDGRHLDVAPPQPWEIAAMLRLSARASNLNFETGPDGRGLDDVLLEHARRNPQALPLLSYVLDQLWEHRDTASGTLRFADFEALGDFEGALAEKARTTVGTFAEDFPTEAAGALDELLHLVVEAGDSGNNVTFVRRRATPEEIAAATPAVQQFAERLVAALLLVHNSSGVTFAHDALLSEAVVGRWDALRKWLEASAQNLLIRERVARRCHDWSSNDRSGELLLPPGSLLSDAALLLRTKPSLFETERPGIRATGGDPRKGQQGIAALVHAGRSLLHFLRWSPSGHEGTE